MGKRWKEVSKEERAELKQRHDQAKQEYELFWQENPELAIYKPRKKKKTGNKSDPSKLKFPFKKIQNIVKSDPDVAEMRLSKKTYLAIGKAMELFLVKHAKEAMYCAKKGGRKMILDRDVVTAVYRNEEMDFLRADFELPTGSIKRPASAKKNPNAKSRKKQK